MHRVSKKYVLNELFHGMTPVRSTLKSVDGFGAVDSRNRPDFWGQILTLHAILESISKQSCRHFRFKIVPSL
jgi:hypothetical protein